MKKATRKKETKAFSEAVGRALRRAAKAARKPPRCMGRPSSVGKRQGGGKEALNFVIAPTRSSSRLLRFL